MRPSSRSSLSLVRFKCDSSKDNVSLHHLSGIRSAALRLVFYSSHSNGLQTDLCDMEIWKGESTSQRTLVES